MRHLIPILSISLCLSLSGCFDIFESTYWSNGNYSVSTNPGNTSSKTLYYDFENGSGIGRVDYVSQIGSNDRYIVIKSSNPDLENEDQYWILDKTLDNPMLNSEEIIEGPLNLEIFQKRKIELEINNLDFQERIK